MAHKASVLGQDKKEFEKYTKYLLYKSIQIIVQSRLGERIKTISKPVSSGSDWFNLSICDLPDIYKETKKCFQNGLSVGQPANVEISLKTPEGELVILENWSLCLTENCSEVSGVKVSHSVYNRMGILLKSLFSVCRATPAHNLSRKQLPDSDTYLICYKIYEGKCNHENFGKHFKNKTIATLQTHYGYLTLYLSYRVKLIFPTSHQKDDIGIHLNDNHFHKDNSQSKDLNVRPLLSPNVKSDINSQLDADVLGRSDNLHSTSPPEMCVEQAWATHDGNLSAGSSPLQEKAIEHALTEDKTLSEFTGSADDWSSPSIRGAFAPAPQNTAKTISSSNNSEDLPFKSLIQPSLSTHSKEVPKITDTNIKKSPEQVNQEQDVVTMDTKMKQSSASESNKSTASHESTTQDDFIMVELNAPFASSDKNSELGHFYRDCQIAPQLKMFESVPTVQETINSITDQIASFESNSRNFDEFVDSLYLNDG